MGKRRRGNEILNDLDRDIHKKRDFIHDLNQKISNTSNRVELLQHQKAAGYIRLAELRAQMLDDPEIAPTLTHAEKQAQAQIMNRQKSRLNIDHALTENETHQTKLEEERVKLAKLGDDLDLRARSIEEKALTRLTKDPAYQALFDDIELVETQIQKIDDKLVVAHQDYEEKRQPYINDPLFMYLWERGYGTSQYQAGNFVRMMDAWVAKIVDYEPARRNYALLSSIEDKFKLHKESLEEQIVDIQTDIDELEKEEFEKSGALALRLEGDQNIQALEDLDREIEKLEIEYDELLMQKDEFTQGKDVNYQTAIKSLQALYEQKSLQNLRRAATLTVSPEDDQIIAALTQIDEEMDHLNLALSDYQTTLREEKSRLLEVQNVRKTFKDKKYDRRNRVFEDGNMFMSLLDQFISGVLTNPRFWSAVGHICAEVLDEIDFDDVIDFKYKHKRRSSYKYHRSKSRRSKSRSGKSKGRFRTGGGF